MEALQLRLRSMLAKTIAADGEGARPPCDLHGAAARRSEEQAELTGQGRRRVPPWSRRAMFGADANWGRVLCAMGYSGAEFDPNDVDVTLCLRRPASSTVCAGGPGRSL